MTYPASTREAEAFTPASLANMTSPPSFRIKPASEADKRALGKLLITENLRHHPAKAIREETLRGLRAGWSEDDYAANEGRIRAYWDAFDQHVEATSGEASPTPFEHEDSEAMEALSKQVFEAWPPLRGMAADNADYDATWPSVILSVMLTGWKNLDVKFRREARIIPLDTIALIRKQLDKLEREEGAIEGVAFMQLCAKAAGLFGLTGDEEKNSASPSPSAKTPTTSTTDGPESAGTSSTASASSTETPAA